MTRTDVVASSRPQKAGAAPKRKGSSSAMRRLVVLPVAFALTMALVLPGVSLAAEEPLSGYTTTTTTTTTPTTTPTTTATTTPAPTTTAATPTPTPTTGTSPSKEKSTPTKTTAPEKASTEPTSEPVAKKASTLPFTGFDLRWTIGGGVLLIAMGFSLVVAQRRQRRSSGR
jgi:uncharacterized surface anchored protein